MSKIRDLVENERPLETSGAVVDTDTSVTAVADSIPIRDANAAISGKNQCTAWAIVHFDGTNIIIRDSYNIASITRTAAGRGVVTFAIPMATTNYSIDGSSDSNNTYCAQVAYDSYVQIKDKTSIGYRNCGVDGNLYDLKESVIVVFGGR